MRTAIAAFVVLCGFSLYEPVTQDPKPEAGRAGTVVDRQGTALVRPVGRERWTPLRQQSPLFLGDQVRTEPRGANAVEIALSGGATLVLGPGALVEVVSGDAVKLQRGEVEVGAEKGRVVKVSGPGGFSRALAQKTILRASETATVVVAEPPRWLTGYRSSTTDEWLGSLLANVDGRAVPLHVGYHKVDVVIKDQIAQTTIEESFVNTTNQRLEGTFRFPLPADASIAGFGMWIGNELVEADIVEKQRARQIYETILRERRDPGLLEWSGGNLFTARVFPIEAHSEKRIRLRYTQVLPLVGGAVRYRYALKSELLRQHPLRQLAIKVLADSTVPIAEATSTTHPVRARKTRHQAVLEYDASEVRPERDFEARLVLEQGAPLMLVPHRRGDDGYFMLLLNPPDPGGGRLQRELLPERSPLRLLLLADTSGSIDEDARRRQERFLQALLSQLGPKDSFELWACDTSVQRCPATTGDQALAWLAARNSLGWTDLERAVTVLAEHAAPGTTIVYAGDGIATSGDGDVQGLSGRLRALLGEKQLACHAVALGSTFDLPVLEALASAGGSVRPLADEAVDTAFALLAEAGQPVVKDLRIEFDGLRTARVYPERLPNVAAGTQQIVLGRYLPAGKEQRGKVTVTGTLEGKPLRYAADVVLKDGEEGNSFLPRLWARQHLDALLALGTSRRVQDEIVAFSIEYGILTPYTSLLVLESDADRERFGVERRVRMRDGEQFFAQAADRARLEVLREQMQLARTWRLQLRERMLREIGRLGKDLHGWQVAVGQEGYNKLGAVTRGRRGEFAGKDFAADGPMARPASEPVLTEEEKELDRDDAGEKAGLEDLPHEAAERFDEAQNQPSDSVSELRAMKALREEAGYYGDAGARGWVQDYRGQARHYMPGWTLQTFGFPVLAPMPAPTKTVAPKWEPEIVAVLRSLDRRTRLAGLAPGLAFELREQDLHALRGHVLRTRELAALAGSEGWHWRRGEAGDQARASWLLGGRRKEVAAELRLGRERAAAEGELQSMAGFEVPLADASLTDFVQAYATWDARITARDGGRLTVALTHADREVRLEIDVEKRLLVTMTSHWRGKLQVTTRGSDFVQVAGEWFAQKSERRNGKDQLVGRQELRVREPEGGLAAALQRATAGHDDVLWAAAVEPTLAQAKQARQDDKAGFVEHFVVALHLGASGQWDECLQAFAQAEKAAPLPGVAWLRLLLLAHARRGEECKAFAHRLAETPAAARTPFLDHFLFRAVMPVLAPQEQEALWGKLRPAGTAGPLAERAWSHTQVQILRQLNRAREAQALLERLWQEDTNDFEALRAVVDLRTELKDLDQAIDLVRTVLGKPAVWTVPEQSELYRRWTDLLLQRARPAELRPVLEAWLALEPEDEDPYVRWLSALLYTGDEAVAVAWIGERLAADAMPEPGPARARLGAAISLALGNGWGMQLRSIEDRWLLPLAQTARRLARGKDESWLAQRIVHDWRFQRTDASQTLRQWFEKDLVLDLASMPFERLSRYLGWIAWDRTQVDQALFDQVAAALRARHAAAGDDDRAAIAQQLLRLLDAHGEHEAAVAFLRELVQREKAQVRAQHARDLQARLARLPWSEAVEEEMTALLVPILEGLEAPGRGAEAADLVRWLAEACERMRAAALAGPVAELEKLSREMRRARSEEASRAARRALAAAFGRRAAGAAKELLPWLMLERACWLTQLGEPKDAEAEARELLEPLLRSQTADLVQALLAERLVLVLSHAATRKQAPAELADRVVATLMDLARESKDPRPAFAVANARAALFRLLVALDRPEPLLDLLRAWVVPGKVDSEWRRALAFLQAERGQLREAVLVFEQVAALGELSSADYLALASWHLVLNDDARREQALLARYRVLSEQELSAWLWREQQHVSRSGDGIPQSLHADTLPVLRVLLGKASRPASYTHQVQQLYATTKDHRLLESLADGVESHTVQAVYAFLATTGQVTSQVHEEATCDALAQRIVARLSAARNASDRRALTLLAMLVERRAAEVQNQRGPHASKALAALKEAFHGDWQPGERPQLATFLAGLGRLPESALAAERQRQLDELWAGETDPALRLLIASCSAHARWAQDEHDAAIDGLSASLREHQRSRRLDEERRDALFTLVGWLEHKHRFADAESWLLQHAAFSTDRLRQLYVAAVRHEGTVSLGRGRPLYDALRRRFEDALFAEPAERRDATLTSFCELHRAAATRGMPGGEDLVAFARSGLLELATLVPMQATDHVLRVAQTVRELSGPLRALEVAVARLEKEPRWLARSGHDLWSRNAWQIADWRREAGRIGKLEAPLLARVLRGLEDDLVLLSNEGEAFYHRHNSCFWGEHEADFVAVIRKVVELHGASPARVLRCATTLWHALQRHDEAIRTLLAADARNALELDGRASLVRWYAELRRYAEGMPHLERMLAASPDKLEWCWRKIAYLHGLGRDGDARSWLASTRKRLEEQKRWDEQALATLAGTCFTCELWAECTTLYEEAIPLHQRTARNRGIGDGTLSHYYSQCARAYGKLGKHGQAVAAAFSAVVSWGRNEHNQRQAVDSLRAVLAGLPDLPAFLAKDQPPLVRKLAGLIFVERGQHAAAIAQLTRVEPDPESLEALRVAYEKQGDRQGLCATLLLLGRFDELAGLLEGDEAERAFTTLVERAFDDARSHRQLAEHYEKRARLLDAIAQWRHVVRIRALEPDGWLALAKAQMRAGRKDDARATIDHVLRTEWEPRFGDVRSQAAGLMPR